VSRVSSVASNAVAPRLPAVSNSALHQQPQVEIGQPAIGLEQQPGAVGQPDFREVGRRRHRRCRPRGRFRRRGRIQRDCRQPVRIQIGLQGCTDIRGRDATQVTEIGPAMVEVADDNFRHAEARRLAAHRLARVDFAHHELAHRLPELTGGKPARRTARQGAMNRGLGRLAFARIAGERNAKEPRRARIPGGRVDRVDEAGLFPNLLPQDGTVAVPQHHRKQVEHRRVGVCDPRDRPRQHAAGHLHVLKPVLRPRRQLRRLHRHQHRREANPRRAAKMLLHLRPRGGQVDVAHDDHDQVVRHVS
jgi:hypothetical protein